MREGEWGASQEKEDPGDQEEAPVGFKPLPPHPAALLETRINSGSALCWGHDCSPRSILWLFPPRQCISLLYTAQHLEEIHEIDLCSRVCKPLASIHLSVTSEQLRIKVKMKPPSPESAVRADPLGTKLDLALVPGALRSPSTASSSAGFLPEQRVSKFQWGRRLHLALSPHRRGREPELSGKV